VKRSGSRSNLPWIYAGSIAAHVALGVVLALLPTQERGRVVPIDFADFKKKTEPPKPPLPLPPPPPKERGPKAPPPPQSAPAQAKVDEEPAKEPPRRSGSGADGFADLGAVALDGAGAAAHGAVAIASPARAAAAPKAIAHRIKQLIPIAQNDCTEPVVKPKVKTPGQITYTKEGQEAEIEGVVRVQVTVDETGKVITASVISGLGYGLDERALAAARDTLFEPATLCRKPVVATKVLAFTFELR
jgi:periplasmic protein TonB